MRTRLGLALAATTAVAVVGGAVVVTTTSGDDPPAAPAGQATTDDPRALDVLVLVPDSPHAAKDRELVSEAVGMWQRGIDAIADEPDLGWLRDARIQVADAPAGDGATYTLRDPEVVIVAATPPGGPTGTGSLRVHGADDSLCESVDDPFAYGSWAGRPGFRSHHSLPEGTWIQHCGGDGGSVCYAVNATIDSSGAVEDVFATFGLVSDELGHCLTAADDYVTRP